MKTYRTVFVVVAAAFLSIASALASDPAGTWKWTFQGRDGQARESVLKLAIADGQLTGTLSGRNGQELPISAATFVDGEVAFTVNMTWGERSMSVNYRGKVEGDTITGSIERPSRDGAVRKDEWKATRAK